MIYVTLFTQTVYSERASELNKLSLKGGGESEKPNTILVTLSSKSHCERR